MFLLCHRNNSFYLSIMVQACNSSYKASLNYNRLRTYLKEKKERKSELVFRFFVFNGGTLLSVEIYFCYFLLLLPNPAVARHGEEFLSQVIFISVQWILYFFVWCFSVFVFVLDGGGSCFVTHAGWFLRLKWSFCLCLPSTGIIRMHHCWETLLL